MAGTDPALLTDDLLLTGAMLDNCFFAILQDGRGFREYKIVNAAFFD